uniref:Uncharacterized protein n=1 Tax=Nicotiana tabacum TaxID=4097 RepID=A0A1S4D0M9_TOBAC|nr:uncharacterized protein LOC104093986 [Nicotiana tomentosiformis]XP_016506873.1 PREDICTED: uncharacterized protein LOC107824585 [Nicotiana tabacum]
MAGSEFSQTSNENSETQFNKRRRCFCFPSFGSTNQLSTRSVWAKGINALKKLREWSEMVAGPRWKTFIRRFNRNKSGRINAKFQYDPLSYSLNFDEGPGNNKEEEEEYVLRNFSTRYASASISAPAKVSMDFSKDGPSFV